MKLKKFTMALMATAVIGSSVSFNPAMAYPVDECSIWLCLPVGFSVSGCGAGKSIFLKKLRKGKNPIPSWGMCAVAPKYSQETLDGAKQYGIALDFKKPVQPYNTSYGNYLYLKGSDQKIKEYKSNYNYKCNSSGNVLKTIVYTKHRGGKIYTYKEEWTAYNCNVSWVVKTTPTNPADTDLKTIYMDYITGMEYTDLVNQKFESKMVSQEISVSSDK